MILTKFLSAGSNEEEAIKFACNLSTRLFFNEDNLNATENLDIRCKSSEEADKLNEMMWIFPKDVLIPHSLTHEKDEKVFAEIGYPGGKFLKKNSKTLINLNPDLPNQISDYLFYFQLVIEDNSSLRERAAVTWTECVSMGLEPTFIKN